MYVVKYTAVVCRVTIFVESSLACCGAYTESNNASEKKTGVPSHILIQLVALYKTHSISFKETQNVWVAEIKCTHLWFGARMHVRTTQTNMIKTTMSCSSYSSPKRATMHMGMHTE